MEVTRTNLYFGNNIERFVNLVKEHCRGGIIGILYSRGADIVLIDKRLGKSGYTIKGIDITSPLARIPDNISFCIVVIDIKHFSRAKSLLKNTPHCFYSRECDFKFFSDSDCIGGNRYSCASFVFFEENRVFFDKNVKGVYASMFALLTHCVLLSYSNSYLPCEDRGLNGVINSLKKGVLEKTEEDCYLKEGMRLCKMAVDYLQNKDKLVVLSERCVREYSPERKILNCYFINTILRLFTKWDFFDMLIPAERLISPREMFICRHRDDKVLLTKEELSSIISTTKGFFDYEKTNPIEILARIDEEIIMGIPIFPQIHDKGILLKLIENGTT